MAFNIEQFMGNGPVRGGARPNSFEIIIPNWPGSTTGSEQSFRFMAKASQIPPSILGQIELPYFGRRIKVAGDRVYTNWNVSIMNDESFNIRTNLETWHEMLNGHVENVMSSVTPAPLSYKRDAIVRQMSKDGTILKAYTFKGIFPVSISEIGLDWEANDQVEMFEVDFSIDYWLPFDDRGQNASDVYSNAADGASLIKSAI